MFVPKTSRKVNDQIGLLPEAKSMIYHSHINIQKPILTSDNKKITESRDMLIALELPHSHAWEVPCATPNAYQRDAKKTNTMSPTLPPYDSLLDFPGLVNKTQAKQILQQTISIPSKRKIKSYKELNPVPPQKLHRLFPGYRT